jgi:excisionase family DNA binding protein
MENQSHRLLSRKEAAEYLGVSISWLKSQASAGTGPAYYKVGSLVKYSQADLAAWLAGQRTASPLELLTIDWNPTAPSGDQAGT